MFNELMPMLRERTVLITVAKLEQNIIRVNVIPTKAKEGEDPALTTPLSYTGDPQELDREFPVHLANYIGSHLELGSTLAQAQTEMEAAAKAARQKVKSAQQSRKSEDSGARQEAPNASDRSNDTTPSLFTSQPDASDAPTAQQV